MVITPVRVSCWTLKSESEALGMRVRDVMSRTVTTIAGSDSCYQAALRMSRLRIHHLPVVDPDGRLEGVLTHRDLRASLFLTVASATEESPVNVEDSLRERRVREIMSAPPVAVSPDEALAAAVRAMAERKIGSMPVVENNRVVGMLTETDVLRLLFRRRLFSCPDVEAVLLPVA
jgi:CBS domain-containing protein